MIDLPATGLDLTDQVAIVTGGGGGIGRACALRLADFGADIVVAETIPERCAEVVAQVETRGRRAIGVPTDMMETDQIRAMVAKADATFGRVDILVNNAGGVSHRLFAEQSERSWRGHIDINLVSMLAANSAVIPILRRGGRGGSIVNVSSIEGSRGAPGYAVYAACKAGMLNFTGSMALELPVMRSASTPSRPITRSRRAGAATGRGRSIPPPGYSGQPKPRTR